MQQIKLFKATKVTSQPSVVMELIFTFHNLSHHFQNVETRVFPSQMHCQFHHKQNYLASFLYPDENIKADKKRQTHK